MTTSGSSNWTGTPKRTKVGRLITEYDLGDTGSELEQRWTGDGRERDSLRTLADAFNQRLLSQAMSDAGMDPLEGEVENVYRLLTDGDVSSGNRIETEARLRKKDIVVEDLLDDFVTYQAIRTYLQDVRDASYEQDTDDSFEAVKSSIDRLIGRTNAVVEQKLQQFRSKGSLTIGNFIVRTSVVVYCEDCETQYEVASLLRRGSCDCQTSAGE